MTAEFMPVYLALFLGLYFSLKLLWISIFKHKSPDSQLPKGNMGWPLVGETLAFLKPHKSNSISNFLQEHCSRYGKVFKSHLFGTPTIVSCDLELNIFILQNEERLFLSSYPKPVQDILGKLSMMHVSGELHKKLRSVAISFINVSKSRHEFLHYVEKLSLSLIGSWKEKKRILFFKEAKEARTRISSTLMEMIKKRRKFGSGQVNGDFLDDILMKECLNDEERASVLLDLFLAGYETTSGLIALIVYSLKQAPLALQRLKEEHQTIRKRKKDGDALNFEDYKEMEFASYVINETLRYGNLVKFVHRKAVKDVKFKDYLIPAGWQVLPIFSATHLDPTLHHNPFEFNPHRWTDPATSKKVTPFGGGLRYCPGMEIGKLETAFFLHHFVLNFRWKLKEDDYPMSCPYMEFKGGLELELELIEKNKG
ncbi:cytochrome P450 724B1-like [Olea europaea var. sylvestris]|uniref:cytochrome P450 724B1-like n=1 Tax=Olea europaea var. sylvestris TaxID=158386 RepID=UPI000C1D65C6|nr:cytochrome P450 724B1-like [Olea europaea var. sylvestris]